MGLWQAYKAFAGGPLGLVSAGVFLTTGAVLGYRWYVSPIMKRRKRDQNEKFADYIFEERQKKFEEIVKQ